MEQTRYKQIPKKSLDFYHLELDKSKRNLVK